MDALLALIAGIIEATRAYLSRISSAEGVVAAVTPSTPHVRVVVDCGFPLAGVNVTAVFKASAAHPIPYR